MALCRGPLAQTTGCGRADRTGPELCMSRVELEVVWQLPCSKWGCTWGCSVVKTRHDARVLAICMQVRPHMAGVASETHNMTGAWPQIQPGRLPGWILLM